MNVCALMFHSCEGNPSQHVGTAKKHKWMLLLLFYKWTCGGAAFVRLSGFVRSTLISPRSPKRGRSHSSSAAEAHTCRCWIFFLFLSHCLHGCIMIFPQSWGCMSETLRKSWLVLLNALCIASLREAPLQSTTLRWLGSDAQILTGVSLVRRGASMRFPSDSFSFLCTLQPHL